MTDLRIVWKPITRWPREQTVNREPTPFRGRERVYENGKSWTRDTGPIGWDVTRLDLERELRALGVREAVVQLALTDRDIRVDGEIKANARLAHPGVILTFTAVGNGALTFACDKWTTWQANIRGVAKGLEALRLLDRYGITTTGEQYAGWKELPSGIPLSQRAEAEEMSVEQAARVIVGWISGTHDLSQNARTAVEDRDYRKYAYRQAWRHLHPDASGEGDTDAMVRLERAMKVLEDNDPQETMTA